MAPVKKVFLSSTARDLAEYRDAAAKAIDGLEGYKCVKMEDFGATAAQAASTCRDRVLECDLYIGILAYNYGSLAPDVDKSYTEIEYDTADPNRRLIFIADAKKGFRVDPDLIEPDDLRSRQRVFREKAGAAYVAAMFTTPEELAMKVVTAIRNAEKKSGGSDAGSVSSMKSAVDRVRNDFELARAQIYVLSDQKEMHDELHQLQIRCVGQMLLNAETFPSDQTRDALVDHAMTLDEAIEKLKNIVTHTSLTSSDSSWIQKLEDVRNQVTIAVETGDKACLDKAIREISRIMATQPSVINDRLKTAAKALKLGDLVASLTAIRDQMLPRLDPAAGEKFREGLATIEALSIRLSDLTNQHDEWQQIDRIIRQVEANLKYGVGPIVDSWPDIKERLDPLTEGNAKLITTIEGMDKALWEARPDDIKRAFRLFNAQATRTFYLVDSALKTLCKELRKIDELTSVIMMMQ
jgi:hypothetical protein